MSEQQRLRAVLAGCGGMGANQARILGKHDDFELVGICDINAERAGELAAELGTTGYSDYGDMLAAERPDVVSVTTDNASHASLTIQAAQTAGVRGVYCEKPMATNMKDAREMVRACRDANVILVINHQRRLGADLVRARALIDAGAIGEIEVIRGDCGGDILSDGTHLIDSILWLCGDRDVDWVFGSLHREINDAMRERAQASGNKPGYRYGHPVENGGMAVIQIKDGPRIELFCGDLRTECRHYQFYQVFGYEGMLYRTGDRAQPNLFICDRNGGPLQSARNGQWELVPQPAEDGRGLWRAEEADRRGPDLIPEGYTRFAEAIRSGTSHPMSGDNALRGFEIVMAIYESARLRRKLSLPLEQDRFPLQVMLEEGEQS